MTNINEIIATLDASGEGRLAYDLAQMIRQKDDALEAARLLCANLDNGGVGHMTLVEHFRSLDEKTA